MRFLFVLPFFLSIVIPTEQEYSKSVLKKINKAIYQLWKIENVQKEAIYLDKAKKAKLSHNMSGNQIYKLKSKGSSLGYLYFSKAKSQYAVFDYMIIFNKNLKILKVMVLVYPEFQGGEIGNTNWLKQFIGKYEPNEIIFDKTIDSISGASLSARSITNGVQNNVKQMRELKKFGFLNQ